VTSGSATLVQSGNRETISQTSPTATLNWRSFNISSNGVVTFKQPTSASVALNQIFQGDPSKILGALSANGTIYLINQNGILFGPGAQVNVASLLATSLNITPQAANGLLQAAQQAAPALASFVDANGNPLPSGAVQVASGANIQAANGQVMLFAPQVTNRGAISANGGQVILAAGDSVYLAPSTDPNLRGLLVEVGKGGTVTNAAAAQPNAAPGQITAKDGNVTLVGLIVNQLGRVSASTSVRANGSIYLLAQDGGSASPGISSATLSASNGGTLTLGSGSETQVHLDSSDTATAVDAVAQMHSNIVLSGEQVTLASHAKVAATSGNVSISAQSTPGQDPGSFSPTPGAGRLVIESGATIDVSGDNIQLPMQSNVIPVQLRGDELADSPLQRKGPLRGQTVYVDIRQSGTLPDGTAWVGSPIGNLSGYVNAVPKMVEQRNLAGGTVSLVSDGAVFVEPGSVLNVSGGSAQYLTGPLNTTRVLGTNGKVYDISQAVPDQTYVGIVSGYSLTDTKWGVTQTFPTFTAIQPGYMQGYDAGQLSVAAPRLVLDGSVEGTTVVGPLQRQLPGKIASGSLYRPVGQLPLGATLSLGVAANGASPNLLLPDVEFAPGTVFNELKGLNGQPFDPLTDPLPDALDIVQVRPDLFGPGGFAFLQLFANGRVSLPADVSLQLPPGGGVAITAGATDVLGSVRAASGSIALTATPTVGIVQGSNEATLTLGPHAALEVSGQWVNDLLDATQGSQLAPLAINGGSVAIAAAGGTPLRLQPGSVIDVSGGGQLTRKGSLIAGTGGSVSLSIAPSENLTPVPVEADATLRGYALAHGGGLSITANAICIAAANCSSGELGTLWMAPSAFSTEGFSRISLDSNLGGLEMTPGTTIAAQQLNYQLSGNPSTVPTGTLLASFATPALQPAFARSPMSITLRTNPVGPEGQPLLPFDQGSFSSAGVLALGAGSVLQVDPGGSLALNSSTSIVDGGALLAPGGSITLDITTKLPISEFLPNQGIWIEGNALISTRGTAIVQTNDQRLRTGTVLAGGPISVSANRGYLYMAPGSVLDASGAAATLDIRPLGANGLMAATPTQVASSGGSITLAAADGMLLNGALVSKPGAGPGAGGGALSITVDGNLYGGEPQAAGPPLLPLNPAQLMVGNAAPIIVAPQTAFPATYTGVGIIPTSTIEQGGFSALALSAINLYDVLAPPGASAPVSTGSIIFTQNTALALPASLRLNAPQISVSGAATVSLTAPYVGLGYDDSRAGAQTGDSVAPGNGTLRVSGDLIDFIGVLGLSGVSSTEAASSGDVRFRGIQSQSVTIQPIAGTLQAQGTLTLQGSQLYPTTLSQFNVVVSGAPENTLKILPGGTGGDVLSAGGQLTLQADTIQQDGVLRAPFGELAFKANSVSLGPGSVTSVSGAGQTIPFGSTQAAADWVYSLPVGVTAVYTQSGPPAKSIVLQANNLEIGKGATIDLSGGGDMQASEFVPGVGGTVDVLANSYNPAEFAIVPKLSLSFAPYDPQLQAGFSYAVGSSVLLGGGGPVPAGDYAIMPAGYALLPGAYLVRPVSGFADIVPGTAFVQADGSTVVAGRFAQAGTNISAPQTQGFDLLSTAIVQTEAQYNLTSANTFFSRLAVGAGPNGTNAPVAPLPRDGGDLQLIAGHQLQFLGTLLASAASGGRGALVDISANQLEITAGSSGSAQPGAVTLNAAQLNSLGAQSLLIGGTRQSVAGSEQITTTATDLTVDLNAQLTGTELLLTASDTLDVGAGASLTATGPAIVAPTSYELTGGGAFLRVSTGPEAPVTRTSLDASSGNLTVAAGAVLKANNSITLEATGDLVSQAAYKVPGGSLAFTASQISLGSAVSNVPGLTLSPAALTALDLTNLSLTSASSIGIYGANTLKVLGSLALQTSAIEAATPDASIVFEASQASLGGATAITPLAPTPSTGRASVQADLLTLSGGATAFTGFSGVTLTGTSGVHMAAAGSVSSDSALTVHTAGVTTAPGVDYELSSSGPLQLAGATAKSPPLVPGAGGELLLSGSSVLVDTAVRLPSGVLQLAASGPASSDGVTLGGSAAINLSGTATTFDTLQVDGNGGRLLASSAAGGISMASGAVIGLSASGPNAVAGELLLSAPNGAIDLQGTLRANASTPASGGQLTMDAQTLPALGALSGLLDAAGFTGSVSLRQRGAGDLVLPASAALSAHEVTINADGGSVDILGTIDASGVRGGSVLLTAQNAVDVGGTIRANASGAGQAGGAIQLWSEAGNILVDVPAVLSLSGGSGAVGGTLSLRVPDTSLTALVGGSGAPPPVRLAGTITGSSQVVAEGVETYVEQGDVVLTPLQMSADPSNPIYASAANFMQNAAAIGAALAGSSGLNVSVVPGIEIQSTGSLTVPSAWDLSQWRFGTTAGFLTLRAAGNLIFQGSLSDGFAGADSSVLPTTPGPSFSYRLVGGADLTASNIMDVLPASQLTGSGSVEIAAGIPDTINTPPQQVMIRTGTGSIDIAAGGDLTFGNRASVVYTAGENSGLGIPLDILQDLAYPNAGGNISVNVGGDIIGAPTNQLVTNWLWRTGSTDGPRTSATGWTVNYAWFEENIGALAGGNVSISAGGSIHELSVAIPTIGIQVGGTTPEQSELMVSGGGTLTVEAGTNITGGSYFVGKGSARITAWDSIGPDQSGMPYATAIAPILALGSSSTNVWARGGLQLEGAVNPFLLPQGRAQPLNLQSESSFSTYDDSSAVSLVSAGGDSTLFNDELRSGGLAAQLDSIQFTSVAQQNAFFVYPGTVSVAAPSGNVFVDGPAMVLWPAHTGNVNLLAEQSVQFAPGQSFLMSDMNPSALPNPDAPLHSLDLVMQQLFAPPPAGIGRIPVHSAQGDSPEDPTPARIVALTGDIDNANLQYIPKPIHLIAGQDIVGLWLQAENLSGTDLTEVSAGRDLVYSFPRDSFGSIISDSNLGVVVEGPGSVLVQAGRNINLGTSAGITTAGNLYNPSLAAEGADASVLAGATIATADISAFVKRYLEGEDTYDSLLISYVAARSSTPIESKSAALKVFASLPPAEQFQLCEQVMDAEIDAGGRAAAGPGSAHGNYSPSFLALETLFPGSTSTNAPNRYHGSLSLYFSRIYTLDGGNLTLTVPGGSINVGISTPPAAFGLSKQPSELGLVAQGTGNVNSVSYGDFEVNESRVFAADGGNILVWSTDGNIDAGRGAKTAISAPAPTLSFDQNGHLVTTFPAALTGSGIQALATTADVSPGNVDLFAPQGVVNANDAGIVAGNLTIGATAVLGRDNITVSGVSVGVPVEVTGLGASLAGTSSVASASAAAAMAVSPTGNEGQAAPVAENALSWLDVFILGFGEEQCKAEEVECLKKQKSNK
jgi:filamentous hemagglutinin family protein